MSYREAPLGTVPRVFCEDGGGYSRPAKCTLCGSVIRRDNIVWVTLPSDPSGLSRPVHATCEREYLLFTKALDLR